MCYFYFFSPSIYPSNHRSLIPALTSLLTLQVLGLHLWNPSFFFFYQLLDVPVILGTVGLGTPHSWLVWLSWFTPIMLPDPGSFYSRLSLGGGQTYFPHYLVDISTDIVLACKMGRAAIHKFVLPPDLFIYSLTCSYLKSTDPLLSQSCWPEHVTLSIHIWLISPLWLTYAFSILYLYLWCLFLCFQCYHDRPGQPGVLFVM